MFDWSQFDPICAGSKGPVELRSQRRKQWILQGLNNPFVLKMLKMVDCGDVVLFSLATLKKL